MQNKWQISCVFQILLQNVFDEGANRRIYFSLVLIPSEAQPFSLLLESIFWLCRLGMHVLPYSLLWDHTKKNPWSLRSFRRKPLAACKKSELTHILLWFGFFFFLPPLSKSFPFSVFWRGPARLHGWSASYVLGSAACLEAVWENSCAPLPEMESCMNAAIVHRACFHLYQNVKTELGYTDTAQWHYVLLLLTSISVQQQESTLTKRGEEEWCN